MRPGHSLGAIGTGTVVGIFGIKGSSFAMRFAPVVPSFGTNMGTHLTLTKDCFGMIAPGSTQIDAFHIRIGCEFTTIKQISKRRVRLSGGSSDIGLTLAVNDAIFKNNSRPSKDEVGSTFYIAILIKLSTVLCIGKQCILIAQKATIKKHGSIATHMHCNGLSDRSG